MATLGSAAQYLSRDALAMWLLETDPWRNEVAAVWPYLPIDGPALKVARQTKVAIGSLAQPLDYNAAIADSTMAPSANVTFTPGAVASRYRISYSALGRYDANQDLDAVEAALAVRNCMNGFFYLIFANAAGGTGSPPTLVSLSTGTNQTTDYNGAALALAHYDTHYFKVSAGRCNAIVSNPAQVIRYLALLRAAGLTPEFIECVREDPILGPVRVRQLALYGTPWYVCDLIQARTVNSQTVSNIYMMVLGANQKDPQGPFGVTGIIPKQNVQPDTMFMRRESNIVYEGASGASELNVDYIFTAGVALGQEMALSIMQNAREGA